VLQGDLASTPLPAVLRMLADGAATGCLHVADPAGEAAQLYLRGGCIYAVLAPGRRPRLGDRLVTSGALAPEGLAEALEAQRTELQGWRLGELLVHLSFVDQAVVEDFVHEQIRATVSDLLGWQHATWKFRLNQRTRDDVVPPVAVDVLLPRAVAAAGRDGRDGPGPARSGRRPPALGRGHRDRGDGDRPRRLVAAVQGGRPAHGGRPRAGLRLHDVRGRAGRRHPRAGGLLEVEDPEHDPEDEELPAVLLAEPAADTRAAAVSVARALGGFGVPDQRDRMWDDDDGGRPRSRSGPVR
jgi:hypothetical protein